jgi:hypothetical protein
MPQLPIILTNADPLPHLFYVGSELVSYFGVNPTSVPTTFGNDCRLVSRKLLRAGIMSKLFFSRVVTD